MSSRARGGAGRTGRRPGAGGTREDILAAARAAFAERGFEGATIRSMARSADVDPALIYHYFGSKQRLFVAAMEIPYDWQHLLPPILEGPREEIGPRLMAMLLDHWEDPRVNPLFRGVVRSAATDPVAAGMLRHMLVEGPFALMARAIGTPDAELRTMLVASHVMGVALLRYVLEVEPLASAPAERVAEMVGPVIGAYLTELAT